MGHNLSLETNKRQEIYSPHCMCINIESTAQRDELMLAQPGFFRLQPRLSEIYRKYASERSAGVLLSAKSRKPGVDSTLEGQRVRLSELEIIGLGCLLKDG